MTKLPSLLDLPSDPDQRISVILNRHAFQWRRGSDERRYANARAA